MVGRTQAARGLVLGLVALGLGCRSGAEGPLQIYAASSLTEAFDALAERVEARTAVPVDLTFAGSQVLRHQIERGAPAELFASANPDHVGALVSQGLFTGKRAFATNEVVIIVPLNGASKVESFEDLAKLDRIVIGTDNVPIGRYTRQLFARAEAELGAEVVGRVRAKIVSEESNVRLVRAKVELGEADAAFVYRTDAQASARVRLVPLPSALQVRARYELAVASSPAHAARAQRFLQVMETPQGQAVLVEHGFTPEGQ